ncbi:hypothetical protein F5Y19DRAFT_470648 [Xylariaceae sp. FL1651]|nr:hypothetical protein F5Y19DRAFT_470648 [Xylariaceae sp. FL1651]
MMLTVSTLALASLALGAPQQLSTLPPPPPPSNSCMCISDFRCCPYVQTSTDGIPPIPARCKVEGCCRGNKCLDVPERSHSSRLPIPSAVPTLSTMSGDHPNKTFDCHCYNIQPGRRHYQICCEVARDPPCMGRWTSECRDPPGNGNLGGLVDDSWPAVPMLDGNYTGNVTAFPTSDGNYTGNVTALPTLDGNYTGNVTTFPENLTVQLSTATSPQ